MAMRYVLKPGVILGLALCAGNLNAAAVRVEASGDGVKTARIAADEFVKYYREITGRDVVDDPVEVTVAVDASLPTEGKDGYRIVSTPAGVRLTGVNGRSALYAVYDLLERRGGCHWFWDGDIVPRADKLDLSGLDVFEKSRFEFRATRYFSHRGLTRFRAQQWGPEDWKREIDYLAKIRVNTFMLRIGQDDMFQRAFPDVCAYPDPAKPLPGAGVEYDNLSLFWSLQFRGKLRRTVMQYGFDRGFLIPEDFGTMTHWYSRTPQDFLEKMKPDFLPQATSGYSEPSGLVWDIRQQKWMDAYWQLTEASIRDYGSDAVLHTMGLSERNCYSNRADNLKLKVEVMKRLCAEARRRHPSAQIILGGWDFHHTWFPDECAKLWPELAKDDRILLWDYEADAVKNYRPEMPAANNFTTWDVIGRFPYVFGVFQAFSHSADIRANYPVIERRWQAVKNDPYCRGYIWWPEVEHSDILFYDYFAANAWRPGVSVDVVMKAFCRKRYGELSGALTRIWELARPMTEGVDWGTLSATEVTRAAGYFDHPDLWTSPTGRKELSRAGELYRLLAGVVWEDAFIRRDTLDLARTVGDRLTCAALTKFFRAYHAWKAGAETAENVVRLADACEQLGVAMAETLALHTDYSLWESFERMNRVEKVRNPNFEKVLVDNATCHYCRGYQYECAEYWYRPALRDLAAAVRAKVVAGDRKGSLIVREDDYREHLLARPLAELAPKTPRTPENYRRAMRNFAAAADLVGPIGDGAAFVGRALIHTAVGF